MRCSILLYPNALSKMDHEKMCQLAGLKVIPLRHYAGFQSFPMSMRGFQGANIEYSNLGGRKNYSYRLTKDRNNNDTIIHRSLVFQPDEDTEELNAIIPDTEFNRVVLAKMYYSPKCPTILNPDIDSDIATRAKKFKKIVGNKKTVEDTISKQALEIKKMKEEKEKLLKELEELEKKNKETSISESSKISKELSKREKDAREKILKEVLKEKNDIIEILIEEYGENKYKKTPEYKEAILDTVDKRVELKLGVV